MMKWFKIFALSAGLLSGLLVTNELLLIKAGHLKTIVSDNILWSMHRERLEDLTNKDIVLLGASRMQVNIDLKILQNHFPESRIIQLAFSGMGTSRAVFEDIVYNTDFDGLIIISETQNTLAMNPYRQKRVINYYNNTYSLDQKLNKEISMYVQENFLFPNPNSNSERLWGTLLGKRKLPDPFFTITFQTREQTSFFELVDFEWLHDMKMNGVKKKVRKQVPIPSDQWLNQAIAWKETVDLFEQKGGDVIFVHMPFSEERWQLEEAWMPKAKYWDIAMKNINTKSIHFAEHKNLRQFKIPDTSHIDSSDKSSFTQELVDLVKTTINSSN